MRTDYTHEDGEEVLKRAIAIETLENDTRDVVRRTAAELGLSQEAVEQAEREYFREKKEREEVREFAKHQRKGFFSHLGTYLVVNTFLFGIDIVTNGGIEWAFYPLMGWGIGLAIHAIGVFYNLGEDYQKEFEAWRAERKASEDRWA